VGGVYSCTCPAWRNQSLHPDRRTCKHLRKLRGDAAEEARIGGAVPVRKAKTADGEEGEGPPVLLAERWDSETDVTGWWMSEKLDGVRAYWDGTQFISRLGNIYQAPAWFIAGLPKTPLDGELWMARKAFQRTVGIVKRQDGAALWKDIRYVVFDAPAHGGVFEERLMFFHDFIVQEKPPYAVAHPHETCQGLDHLRAELARVEQLGGEGLMMRQPKSLYVAGRSTTLLKVKTFLDDEARVVNHLPGAGRHKGRLGALEVELPNGTRFAVGTGFSDAERESPPPIGSIITFRYQELSDAGVPRFPSYVGVREDVSPPSHGPQACGPNPNRGSVRRFEYVKGKSSKFWEITVNGVETTARYGRIGTEGQKKTKKFADNAAAEAYAAKLIAEKTKEGYAEK
jgi:DNA ligase-1